MKSMRRNVKRVAAQELAEADKIKIVTAAEAEVEKTAFMVWGLPNNVRRLWMDWQSLSQNSKEANVGMTEEQIMSILLTNQYLDTLNTFASKGNQTIFLPNTPKWCWMISVHKSCQPSVLRRNNRLKEPGVRLFLSSLLIFEN